MFNKECPIANGGREQGETEDLGSELFRQDKQDGQDQGR